MTLLLPFLDSSLTTFLYIILQYILKLCLILSFCHYIGWTHRAIHFWLEWYEFVKSSIYCTIYKRATPSHYPHIIHSGG